LCIDVDSSFRWLVVKPYGPGHYINGLSVQGNMFRTFSGNIERVEEIDTTYADMDFGRMRNIIFEGNTFSGVNEQTRNPHIDLHTQSSVDQTWTVDTGNYLPFGGWARVVDALVPLGAVQDVAGDPVYAQPYTKVERGSDKTSFELIWPETVKGRMRYSVRMDNPA
jgi:hypothetical protein